MKNNRSGQAKLWNARVIKNMRSRLISPYQRAIFEISLFTGERIGAIVQLQVSDVYDTNGRVLEAITFASNTRKSTKHGSAATRQVAVHPDLLVYLSSYTPPNSAGYLFPTDSKCGHITRRAVDKYWRGIFNDYGYTGYSTHSSRRWVINQLRSKGIEIVTIAESMGLTSSQRRRRGIPKTHDLGFCFIAPAFRDLLSSGLTVAPQTITASPAAKIFFPALMSLSMPFVPQLGQSQLRTLNGNLSITNPQWLHRLELGKNRSIVTSFRPYQSHLYSSCRKNSPQEASLILRASL